MKRPTKRELKEAVQKLKEKPEGASGPSSNAPTAGKPSAAKSPLRIRKKGV